MNSLISLEYPNGRIHEQSYASAIPLQPGDEFELHGRCWSAIGLIQVPRMSRQQQRMLCRPSAPLQRPEL